MAVKSSRDQSSSGVLCQVKAVVSGLDVVRCVESCRAKAVKSSQVLSSYVPSRLVLSRQSGRVESCRIVFGYVKAVLLGLVESC